MDIRLDDLTHPAVHALLEEHMANMRAESPPECVFALDLDKLRAPGISFWTAWEGPDLVGCGAVRELDPAHGEIKSMRTPTARRRRGAGRAILQHIIATARQRGYRRLSLETGSTAGFAAAHALYRDAGFVETGPFGDYRPDPFSRFLTLELH
jgi:putative acetyltransferase